MMVSERFQASLGCCTRALAGNSVVTLTFGVEERQFSPVAARLTHRAAPMSQRERAILRGQADLVGLYQAFHDSAIHDGLTEPHGENRAILVEAEHIRVAVIGSHRFVGVAANLACMIDSRYLQEERIVAVEDTAQRRGIAIGALLCDALAPDLMLPRRFALVEVWRPIVRPVVAERVERLRLALYNQLAFGQIVLEIAAALPPLSQGAPCLPVLDKPPSAQKGDEDPGRIQNDMRSHGEAGGFKVVTEETDGSTPLFGVAEKADSPNLETDAAPHERPDHGTSQPVRRTIQDAGTQPESYRVFTRAYDETVSAHSLLARLKQPKQTEEEPDEEVIQLRRTVTRLAARLERRLLAQQPRAWDRDVEDGVLDPTRLSRVVVNPASRVYFKKSRQEPFRDTVVTLLLDNSASMRGRPIRIVKLCVEILANVLIRVGVRVEILGFTTRSWRGGRARGAWIAAGCPPGPGRLNEVMHIIYKSADTNGRRLPQDLQLMTMDGLHKENIDGEALEWAYERLLRRGEQRRILIAISDGAPSDDATLAVSNSTGHLLESHLRRVASNIVLDGKVELLALGIGYDVAKLYPRSTRVDDVSELSEMLMTRLYELLNPAPDCRRQQHRRSAGKLHTA